ncbi:MAG: glycosyl transferase group 1 [Thermoleophilia bacterium]|nr:glycosyl transferase group 1 [Thermoleophilia bacterium]
MRVAVVDPASWSLAYDAPLGAALARAGCEVTLHCTRSPHGAQAMTGADTAGFTVEESFYRSGYGLGFLPRKVGRAVQHPLDLSKLTRRLRTDADVVMVQWLPGRRIDARAWARLATDVPVTYTAHNAQERDNAVDPDLLDGFSAVIAHSDGGAKALRAAGIADVWRMRLGAYTQYADAADPELAPIDISDGAPLVVLAGLLRDYKGVDVLLEAWPSVAARVPDARLVVAGRPMGIELPSQPPERATIIPRFVTEEELGWLLRRASVCCLPYRRIDMSGIAAAALACGTPLVLSDVGGFGEFVGRGGVTVPPGDANALADALVEVLADPARQAQLATEARAATADYFSWDAIAHEYVECLRGLVHGAAGG